MFVDPTVRGVKLGAAIVDTLEAAADRRRCDALVLETGTRQLAALGLYERFGFAPVPGVGRVPRLAARRCASASPC